MWTDATTWTDPTTLAALVAVVVALVAVGRMVTSDGFGDSGGGGRWSKGGRPWRRRKRARAHRRTPDEIRASIERDSPDVWQVLDPSARFVNLAVLPSEKADPEPVSRDRPLL